MCSDVCESVWDYPRPPRLERIDRHLVIWLDGSVIAETRQALRLLETSHPPTYYFPPSDVSMERLAFDGSAGSFCEWKGQAAYYSITVSDRVLHRAAWTYRRPVDRYAELRDYVAFYPALMDECLVDGEVAQPQPGGFYGGWITSDLKGPFKGEPGSEGW